jgi:hypothetical protein
MPTNKAQLGFSRKLNPVHPGILPGCAARFPFWASGPIQKARASTSGLDARPMLAQNEVCMNLVQP